MLALLTLLVSTVWTAPTASAAAALSCDQNTLYAVNSSGQMVSINATTGVTTNVVSISPGNNALGVSASGLVAYAFAGGGRSIAKYTTTTGLVTSFANVEPSNLAVPRGAVNPATGLYYYGGSGTSASLGAFDTSTDTPIGKVGTVTGLTTGNGDFAFSSRGILFVVASNTVLRLDETDIPTTAGDRTLTTSLVATLPDTVNSPGIAFSTDGYLYVSTGTSILKLDPASGALLRTTAISGSFSPIDLASCNYPNSATAQTDIVERVKPGDQFGLSINGGEITSGNTATTAGSDTGVQTQTAGPALTVGNRDYTVAQTAAGTTRLADYSTTYSCRNVNNNAVIASGTGSTAAFTLPAATGAAGTDVVCTFTNTPRRATVSLRTTLAGARNDPDDQFTVALHAATANGPVVNPTTSSTTAGSGDTVTGGTGTTGDTSIVANRTYVLTEGLSTGSASRSAQYTSTITCVDDAGLQTGLPDGDPFTGSLSFEPVSGADISCVVDHDTVAPTLGLAVALDGSRYAPGDQFTVAVRTGSDDGPVVSSTTSSTSTGSGSTITPGSGTTGTYTGSAGSTYYLTAAAGTNNARYAYSITCVEANGYQTGLPTDEPFTGSTAITPTAGADISCTLTADPRAAELSLEMSDPGSLTVGVQSSYQLRVTNDGGTATTATVGDRLPPNVEYTGVTGTGWTCSASGTVADGQLVTCSGPSIDGGLSSTFSLQVTPRPGAARQVTTNRAAVDPDGGTSPVDPADCTGDDTPTGCAVAESLLVGPGVDLSLAMANPAGLTVGAAASYTLTVTNSGTGPADGATVQAVLPDGLTYTSADGASCTALGQLVTCTLTGEVSAGGGTRDFLLTVTPEPSAAGQLLVNRAAVDTDGGTDPVDPATCTANDSPAGCAVTEELLVGDGVVLSLAKTNPAALTVGVLSTYTLTVTNDGTGPAAGATVRDLLPEGLVYTAVTGDGCSAVGQVVTCTRAGTIAAGGGGLVFSIGVTPSASAAGTDAVNRATVDVRGGNEPRDPAGCTDTATPAGCAVTAPLRVGNGVALSLVKSNPVGLTVGVPATYPLTVTNDGSGPATDATVLDRLPDDLSFVSADGADCTAAGQLLTCALAGEVAAEGGTREFSVTVTPQPGAAGQEVTNRAAVDPEGGTSPVDPADCTAGPEIIVEALPADGCAVTDPLLVADGVVLSLAKTNPATLTVGVASTYTLTVTNNGTGPAARATVRDVLPTGLAFGSGEDCTAAGQVVTCARSGAVAPSGTVQFTFSVVPAASAAGTLVANRATVDVRGGNEPGDPADCTATGTPSGCAVTEELLVGDGVGLSLAKTNPASLTVGVASTYALTVTNNGTGPVGGATVQDVLPAGLTYTATLGDGCDADGQVVTCTRTGAIAPRGGTLGFTIAVTPSAAAAGTDAVNRATVDVRGGDEPGDPADCTADGTPAGCAVTEALLVGDGVALTLAKTNPGRLTVGVESTYTLSVTNNGTGPAGSVTVRDVLADGLVYTAVAGDGCTPAGQVITCTRTGAVLPGDTVELRIKVIPSAAAAGDMIENRATVDVRGGNEPGDPADCTADGTPAGCAVTESLLVADGVALALAKTNPASLTVGVPGGYVLTVTNQGTGPAPTATVRDRLPDGLAYSSAEGADCSAAGQVVTCTLTGPIGPGDSQPFSLNVVPGPGTAGQALTNVATVDVSGGNEPGEPADCDDPPEVAAAAPVAQDGCAISDSLVVTASTLTLVKEAVPVAPAAFPLELGDELGYTFTVTNAGESPLTGLQVLDPQIGTVSCAETALAGGDSTTCVAGTPHIVTQADIDAGLVTNLATATATLENCTTDCDLTSPAASVSSATRSVAGLEAVKTGDLEDENRDGLANAGETIVYTVAVTNSGTVTLDRLRVEDPLLGIACPDESVDPGETLECTGDYVVTAADERAGSITNIAVASAGSPSGQAVSPATTNQTATPSGPAATAAGLARTGGAPLAVLFVGAVLLLAGTTVLARRRRARL